ncbi:MAG: YlmC/YmxH family sporulation protein [Eubacteriales bacterium]|nr:YlmC/YmxH family sporulation protein [Eubacteriales bacterium]
MRVCDLRNKQIINLSDCRAIGYACDIDFDPHTGCVTALIVPGPGHLCGFLGRDFEYIIPYKCVKNIGPDVILVDVCLDKIKEKCV